MYARQDATLNLSSLLKNTHSSGEVTGSGLLTMRENYVQEANFEKPLNWKLVIQSTGGSSDLILRGNAKGEVIMSCRRCLEPVKVVSRSEFMYPMVYSPNFAESNKLQLVEEHNEECLMFSTPEVDFSELILQIFAVDLPLTALCKEDCLGITFENVEVRSLPPNDNESPFAVLKDLKIN